MTSVLSQRDIVKPWVGYINYTSYLRKSGSFCSICGFYQHVVFTSQNNGSWWVLLRPWYCCFNHAKVCIRISFFCIQTSCKTLNGIKRSSFIDTCVIGEFIEPLRNQSGKYSYTWVFAKCIAFNEFYLLWMLKRYVGLLGESCKLYYARWSMLTGFCSTRSPLWKP